MMSHPPGHPVIVCLRIILTSLVIAGLVLPSASVTVYAAADEAPPFQQEDPSPPDDSWDIPAAEVATAPPPDTVPFVSPGGAGFREYESEPVRVDAPVAGLALPRTPIHLQLEVDRLLLRAGEQFTATVVAIPDPTHPAQPVEMALELPPALTVADGVVTRWHVPALAEGDIFRQTVTVSLATPPSGTSLEAAVYPLALTAYAPGAEVLRDEVWIGVASDLPEAAPIGLPPGARAATHGRDGAVLQDEHGEMAVLAPAAAFSSGTQLQYTPIYDFRLGEPSSSPVTDAAHETALPGYQLYLPQVSRGAGDSVNSATAKAANLAAAPQPRLVDGLAVYRLWEMNAYSGTQDLHTFTQPLLLVVSAEPYLAAGLDLRHLGLWTREDEESDWQPLDAEYDPDKQVWIAQVTHFSQEAVGAGVVPGEPSIPSLRGFNSDRFTGAATFQYPIETPAGLGGMKPDLSFSYSSLTIDDQFYHEGDTQKELQADKIGYGWSLAGQNYISRIIPDSKNDYFTLVLNGQRYDIKNTGGGLQTNPHFFGVIDKDPNELFWTIATPDGWFYEFGGGLPADHNSWDPGVNVRDSAVDFAFDYRGSDAVRLAMVWYLRRVVDPFGNYMEFRYRSQRGTIDVANDHCPLGGNFTTPDTQWYTRHTYLKEVWWSGHLNRSNGQVQLQPTLHMEFYFDPPDPEDGSGGTPRSDIPSGMSSCVQNKNTGKRTTRVEVQAKVGSSWHTLRQYTLSQSPAPTTNSYKHQTLTSLQHKSGDGTQTLESFTFTYDNLSAGDTSINNIRLQTIQHSHGGQVTFGYQSYTTEEPDNMRSDRPRYPVSYMKVDDGLGTWFETRYSYGVPHLREPDGVYEFMGFDTATATYYAKNSTTQQQRYEEYTFHRGTWSTPHVARGKLSTFRILDHQPPNATLYQEIRNSWTAWQGSGTSWTQQTTWTENPLWVRLDRTLEWTTDAGKRTDYFYDSAQQNNSQYGNVTKVEERSHSAATISYNSLFGSSPPLNLMRSTVTEYFPRSTNPTLLSGQFVVDKPARVRIFDGAGACFSEERTVYDGNTQYNQAPTQGLATRHQQALSACSGTAAISDSNDSWSITRTTYDSYGNPTEIRTYGPSGGADQVVTIGYDSTYHFFPLSRTYASGFVETMEYYGPGLNGPGVGDSKAYWGQLSEYCDMAGVCTRQSYDKFGRPVRRWERLSGSGAAWPGDSAADILWSYSPPSGSQSTYVVSEWRAPRCQGNLVRKHYNGLGQLVAQQTAYQDWEQPVDGCGSASSGQEIHINYAYNWRGQPNQVSAPRLLSRSAWTAVTPDWSAIAYTMTNYDPLGRPIRTVAPNGVQTYTCRTSAHRVGN